MGKPLEERFWAMVIPTGYCWNWTGTLRDGYGKVNVDGRRGGKIVPAHRVAYELLIGPIQDGLQLDHLCRNRACVNPDHLEPVTAKVNMKRGAWARRSRCANGHDFTAENTRERPGGGRACRTCDRDQARDYRRRQSQSGVFA